METIPHAIRRFLMTIWLPDIGTIPGPRYLAIAERMAADIRTGILKPGDRLPTHRALAWRLKVTVGTVTRAYAEAERRGLLVGEVGRGSFVREGNPEAGLTPPTPPRDEGVVDFSRNFPADLGQEAVIAAALGEVARSGHFASLLGYATTSGLPAHRAAAAAWIRRDGFDVDPGQVVITDGTQHAMMLALAAVARPGEIVLAEELTFYGLKSVASMLSLRLQAIGCDDQGMRPDALDAACRQFAPKAIYVLPTLHNPTTVTMPQTRRAEIAGICRRHDVPIIEDDSYGFLMPDAPLPLAALAPELGIYISSLSKSVAPGLRVGIMRAPGPWLDRLAGLMRASIWMVPPIMAELGARLIGSGAAHRLATAQREEATRRQTLARRLLAGAEIAAPPHAVHVWLTLPEPWRREEFTAAARRRGVGLAPADAFAIGRLAVPHAVRICVTAPPDIAQVERGLAVVAQLLRDGPDAGGTMV
jgi:DNA-binding transcriptional MocR family regulator